ncbi:unnamed protein product [Candida verbasci]|uniref:Rhomboid-type serine protease 2 n=1 Tax=Candida verbasci TaxID=1227364 RepID=A0A9W4U2A5_9ASCO|nr:unnamed protein product [Candida verbasci]
MVLGSTDSTTSFPKQPALTTGFIIFTLILLLIKSFTSIEFSSLVLYPKAPLEFNLNSISLYCLIHQNYTHWLLNSLAISSPLALFEKKFGTVHTGITLNLLAVITALQYCMVGLVLYPNTAAIGSSSLVFSFMTYFAYQEQRYKPIIYTFHLSPTSKIDIKPIHTPFIFLFVCFIIFPQSSFFGHFFGITSGYLLSKGYINKLYPPSNILIKIEEKINPIIVMLNPLVNWYKEEDAQHIRNVDYIPLFGTDIEAANNAVGSTTSNQPPSFNEVRVLGEA